MSGGKGAVSAAPEFPRTLAAVQKAEGDAWAIADAVLFEVGPPGETGARDGSTVRLAQCSRFLADRGFEYEQESLRVLRNVAHAFPPGRRLPACSFAAHHSARLPEVLEEAVRRNGDKPPSSPFVRQFRRELREAEEAAERKRHQDRRRRADEKFAAEREKARQARDAEERRRAEERAERAHQRAEQARREAEEVERKRAERRRREAEAKAQRLARELEDKDVAEALARDGSVGARRVTNAVHEREAARRRRVREENEHRRDAEALPLPAFVPHMVGEVDGWVIALRGITDDDLAGLPADDPFVRQLGNIVRELGEESGRWLVALGETGPELEVIEGTAS